MIKCTSCSTKNINEALFCRNCGKELTKEEKEKKRENRLVKFLTFCDKWKERLTLEFITDHWIYKVLVLVLILGIGVVNLINNGMNVKINENENYKVQYNTEAKEYYLISPTEKTNLDLYIPNRVKETKIQLYNENNEQIEETVVEADKEIVLDKNEAGNYYIIEADYGNNNMDRLKLFVYQEQSIEG